MDFSSRSLVIVFPLVSVSGDRVVETVITAPEISKGLVWLWLIAEEMLPLICIENSGLVALVFVRPTCHIPPNSGPPHPFGSIGDIHLIIFSDFSWLSVK